MTETHEKKVRQLPHLFLESLILFSYVGVICVSGRR